MWELRLVLGVPFCHAAMRRQVEISTLLRLSVICLTFLAKKKEMNGCGNSQNPLICNLRFKLREVNEEIAILCRKNCSVLFTTSTGGE